MTISRKFVVTLAILALLALVAVYWVATGEKRPELWRAWFATLAGGGVQYTVANVAQKRLLLKRPDGPAPPAPRGKKADRRG